MLFVSKDYGDGTYGVTDSEDGVEERYSVEEIRGYHAQGVSIKGVSLKTDKFTVYPEYKDVIRTLLASFKLLHDDFELEFSKNYEVVTGIKRFAPKIVIPDFVKEIGDNAFASCHDLVDIKLPEGLRKIGDNAFMCCTSLTELVIPSTVEYIGYEAFSDCEFKKVELKCGNARMSGGTFKACHELQEVILPKGLEAICNEMFLKCFSLTHIDLPDTITEIGDSAFEGCYLQSIEFPNSLLKIGDNVFKRCKDLTSLTLPKSVVQFQYSSVYDSGIKLLEIYNPDMIVNAEYAGLTGVKFRMHLKEGVRDFDALNLYYDYREELYDTMNSIFGFKQGANKLAYIKEGVSIPTIVEVPEYVSVICAGAFSDKTGFDVIKIPSSVREIEAGAFECSSVKEIIFPDSRIELGACLFTGCGNLKHIKLPKHSTAINQALMHCEAETIELPEDLGYIPNQSFVDCTNLRELYIPDSVRVIEDNTFRDCKALRLLSLSRHTKVEGELGVSEGCEVVYRD